MALVLLSLLLWFLTKESRAETKFVQRGGDVLLQLKKPLILEEDQPFFWKRKGVNILIMTPEKGFVIFRLKGRVDFYPNNQSLLIKNLTPADSQVYTAGVSGDDDTVVAEYTIKVQDAVSPVVLNVSSVSLEEDSCNVTVTCSAASSVINSTFRCINQTCNQEGGEQSEDTPSGSTLHFFLLRGSFITCNHSNQVNWTHDMKESQYFCISVSSKPDSPPHNWVLIVTASVLSVCFFILCIIGLVVWFKKRTRGSRHRMSPTNTEYERPKEIYPVGTRNQTDAEGYAIISPDRKGLGYLMEYLKCATNGGEYVTASVSQPTNDKECDDADNPLSTAPQENSEYLDYDVTEPVLAQVQKPTKVEHVEMNHLNS